VVLGIEMLSNPRSRSRFFSSAKYCIGGHEYTGKFSKI
jgi:hypothetical protein